MEPSSKSSCSCRKHFRTRGNRVKLSEGLSLPGKFLDTMYNMNEGTQRTTGVTYLYFKNNIKSQLLLPGFYLFSFRFSFFDIFWFFSSLLTFSFSPLSFFLLHFSLLQYIWKIFHFVYIAYRTELVQVNNSVFLIFLC